MSTAQPLPAASFAIGFPELLLVGFVASSCKGLHAF
jgi:hypothetical protein